VTTPEQQSDWNPWPHRLAVALVVLTFPLIYVGGLVTTLKAGMAVEDWPTTFGYNMFLYPLREWLAGPFDVFIEHGHRLLASAVGMLTLVVAGAVFAADRRRWMKWFALATVLAVIAQGVLGGMRVVLDQVQLAKIHGCVGPLFFVMTVALAVFTSRRWAFGPRREHATARRLHRAALVTTILAYVQLVLGTHLRHVPAGMDPYLLRWLVVLHLVMAAAVAMHVLLLALAIARHHRGEPALVRPAMVLTGAIAVQLLFGAGSWVSKYGWPAWFHDYAWAAGHLVIEGSPAQAALVTAHMAFGSLIVALGLLITVRGMRLLAPVCGPQTPVAAKGAAA
jgi:heme a synthase